MKKVIRGFAILPVFVSNDYRNGMWVWLRYYYKEYTLIEVQKAKITGIYRYGETGYAELLNKWVLTKTFTNL